MTNRDVRQEGTIEWIKGNLSLVVGLVVPIFWVPVLLVFSVSGASTLLALLSTVVGAFFVKRLVDEYRVNNRLFKRGYNAITFVFCVVIPLCLVVFGGSSATGDDSAVDMSSVQGVNHQIDALKSEILENARMRRSAVSVESTSSASLRKWALVERWAQEARVNGFTPIGRRHVSDVAVFNPHRDGFIAVPCCLLLKSSTDAERGLRGSHLYAESINHVHSRHLGGLRIYGSAQELVDARRLLGQYQQGELEEPESLQYRLPGQELIPYCSYGIPPGDRMVWADWDIRFGDPPNVDIPLGFSHATKRNRITHQDGGLPVLQLVRHGVEPGSVLPVLAEASGDVAVLWYDPLDPSLVSRWEAEGVSNLSEVVINGSSLEIKSVFDRRLSVMIAVRPF